MGSHAHAALTGQLSSYLASLAILVSASFPSLLFPLLSLSNVVPGGRNDLNEGLRPRDNGLVFLTWKWCLL